MLVIVLSLIYLTYQDKLGQGPRPLSTMSRTDTPMHRVSRKVESSLVKSLCMSITGGWAVGGGWHEVVLLSQEEGCYKNNPQGYAECPRQC